MNRLKKWLSSGNAGPKQAGTRKTLALLTVAILIIITGRAVLVHLRPHIEEEPQTEQMSKQARYAILCIGQEIQEASFVQVEDDVALYVWHSPIDLVKEPHDLRQELVKIHVNEDQQLVTERNDERHVLAENVEYVEFRQVEARQLGMFLRLQANAESIEVRHLFFLKGHLSSDEDSWLQMRSDSAALFTGGISNEDVPGGLLAPKPPVRPGGL